MDNRGGMDFSVLKKRYIGLDILRVVSALVVCMFHTTIHLGCDYGIMHGLSKMGAVFMTAFFMLSGFSLFINWGRHSLSDISNIKQFYKKRFWGIMPMYWVACMIFILYVLVMREDTLLRTIALAPIETFGLQSVFSSLFGFSHNGGTWFISCILICYFVYPLLQEIIKNINMKSRIWIMVFLIAVLLYSPIIVHFCKLQTLYSNPFFRLLEFMIGMILASLKLDFNESRFIKKFICNWITVIIVSVIMIVLVTIAVRLDIAVDNYMLYSWICLPCFIVILYGLSGIESKKMSKSKILTMMSGASYVFFLAQLYSNNISMKIINAGNIEANSIKMAIGWGVCIVITIVLRFIEIAIKKLLEKRILGPREQARTN